MSRFAFVAAERGNHAVAMLCRIMGASVSGFYAWLRAIPAIQARAEAEAELCGHIGRSSPLDAASMALLGSMPSCAVRGAATPAGASRG